MGMGYKRGQCEKGLNREGMGKTEKGRSSGSGIRAQAGQRGSCGVRHGPAPGAVVGAEVPARRPALLDHPELQLGVVVAGGGQLGGGQRAVAQDRAADEAPPKPALLNQLQERVEVEGGVAAQLVVAGACSAAAARGSGRSGAWACATAGAPSPLQLPQAQPCTAPHLTQSTPAG